MVFRVRSTVCQARSRKRSGERLQPLGRQFRQSAIAKHWLDVPPQVRFRCFPGAWFQGVRYLFKPFANYRTERRRPLGNRRRSSTRGIH